MLGGKLVRSADPVGGLSEILDAKHDELPEQGFYMVGGLEEAIEKGRRILSRVA